MDRAIIKNNVRAHKTWESLLMKLSQSNWNLRSPDCYLVRSYLIATVSRTSRKIEKDQNVFQRP